MTFFAYNHKQWTGMLLLAGAILLSLFALSPAIAFAQVDTFEFDTIEQQQRFRQLSNELRCPQCQNANLTGSSGGIAEDLRREVHRMIMEGLTNEEIDQFMFERYGDFIFYRPRLRVETVLLWFGPAIFLLAGGFVAFAIARRSRHSKSDTFLNSDQQARLKEILGPERSV